MPTITIHVSEELNERLACAVEINKLTAEDFILLAVAEKLERPDAMDGQTSASYAEYLRSGESVPLAEVREYFESRIAGKTAKKPAFRKTKVLSIRSQRQG
ncbi:CopG family transcriptional regulator [Rugamonas sp. FT107W]|uniref:CopG family transcriptional regulator n=1 Tax=Duganella vulcania TaxID=2692166 RepID=A0A845HDS9_9BURK|nr:CopG family transcriptional regulator [Duganella vulcania]MYN17372.1 CopG family transcriptional regulator [Duganella vulcania]